jgi:predicted esterase
MNIDLWPHLHRPGSSPAAPALLLLHGTGGNEHDLVGIADRIAPGSTLVAPRGRVSERGANRFFARLAEGVFDPAEVSARTGELARFVQAAASRYELSAFTAIGFSNGANVAATLLQLHPDVPIRTAVLLRSMVVLDQPARSGSLTDRRILLLNGDHDPIISPDHPPRLAALLSAGGARVESRMLAAGHGLISEDILSASAFVARL